MYRGLSVGVVVPAYNEAGFVADVIQGLPEFVDRIFAVDDGSTDGTWEELTALASGDERQPTADAGRADGGTTIATRLVPLRHETNRGAGAAIKTGYLAALEARMDVTVTIDGDGQMDASQIERLLDPIAAGVADYSKGNRFHDHEYLTQMPRFRRFGNRLLSALTKIASGYWHSTDTQNGFTAITYDSLEAIGVEDLYEYYGYCDEVLVRLNVHGRRVVDVPMPAKYGAETSSIRYLEYIPRVSSMLLRNFLWRLYRKYWVREFHPILIAYAAGGMANLLAGGLGIAAVLAYLAGAPAASDAMRSLNFLLFGVLFLTVAMLAEYAESRRLATEADELVW